MSKQATKKLSRTLNFILNTVLFGIFVLVASSVPNLLWKRGNIANADTPIPPPPPPPPPPGSSDSCPYPLNLFGCSGGSGSGAGGSGYDGGPSDGACDSIDGSVDCYD